MVCARGVCVHGTMGGVFGANIGTAETAIAGFHLVEVAPSTSASDAAGSGRDSFMRYDPSLLYVG